MTKQTVLSAEELEAKLVGLTGWGFSAGELVRVWEFADFKVAMAFVNRVAEVAEGAGHHPDIDIRWNKVRLALVTHDSGGITERDVEMAGKLSSL